MSVYENARRITTEDGRTYIEVNINGVSTVVPIANENRIYAEMMEQVAEGTLTIVDAE